jgi:hypothetical protein
MKVLNILLFCLATNVYAETPKSLNYKYNENIFITITNSHCLNKDYIQEYPNAAIASHANGSYLLGCFKKKDENTIELKWPAGDILEIPANYFLDNVSIEYLKEVPKATL